MLQAKKLPVLADIRDESGKISALCLNQRRLEAESVMESLFKPDLEVRVPLNSTWMRSARVMDLRAALNRGWRIDALFYSAGLNLAYALRHSFEVLDGYLVVYSPDQVIAIIREADHPRDELMSQFKLTENQAAVLDMVEVFAPA